VSLPASRDLTINPADPIPSAVINKLQDCVVAQKHPAQPRTLGPSSWHPKVPGSATLGAGEWTINNTTMVGDLDWIPVGDRIVNANWSYNPGGVSLDMSLRRRKLDGTAEETLFSFTDSTGSAVEQSLQAYNHTVVAGYSYYLQAIGNAAGGQKLLGATVTTDCL